MFSLSPQYNLLLDQYSYMAEKMDTIELMVNL